VVTAPPVVIAEAVPVETSARQLQPALTDPIKVGILYSLSGTMAMTETSLKDVALMAIEELNAGGGVLGRKLEPVVVDPESNWPLFAEKARQLLQMYQVAVIFGCYTSVSRKSVLPTVEELDALLFYPAQFEGEEASNNVFYLGATPQQQAIPAVEYLMNGAGAGKKRWVLLGTDYVFPRQTNRVIREFLSRNGVADADILERYTPFGHDDYRSVVSDVKKFAQGTRTVVVSTLWGDSTSVFYGEFAKQRQKNQDLPVMALSVNEEDLRGVDVKPFVGHLAAWSYFASIESPENARFAARWKAYVNTNNLPDAPHRVTNDPMEATYLGVMLWARAVKQAGSIEVENVRQAMAGQVMRAPSGFDVRMDDRNHHLARPVFVGKIASDGQFSVVWKSAGPIRVVP